MATIKSLRILMYVDHSRMSGALQKAKDKVQTAAMSMAKALATGFAAREIGRSVVASIKEAMKMESFAVDIAVLGGGGTELFDRLKKEALKSPFPIDDWMLGGKRLLGAQVPIERVVKILRMLGEMAAGTGSSIKELGLVFTQIWAKGRLQGEEMLQFMERNVSLSKALQKVLDVNKEQMQKMQEAGLITPEHVIQAMEEMTKKGGLFGGMMDAKMQTIQGAIQRFKNTWSIFLAEIGARFIPILSIAASLFASMVDHGYFLRGFFAAIVTTLNIIAAVLTAVVGALHFIDVMTLGIFGWVTGIAVAFAGIGFAVFLINQGISALIGRTSLWGFVSAGVQGIWTRILALVTASTGGLNLLLAAVIAIGSALFWWLGSGWMTEEAGQFKGMKKDAEAIRDAMNATKGVGRSVKLALFGTEGAANAAAQINAKRQEIMQQQLDELKRIRQAVSSDKEDEEWREHSVWRGLSKIQFSP